MSNLAQFHFIRPLWLLLLIPLIGLIWFAWRQSHNTETWTKLCDAHLLPYLLINPIKQASYLPYILFSIIGPLVIVALAGPAWEKLPQPTYRAATSTVFLLDLSRSMDSTDIAPSRLSRAKLKLLDILNAQREGQSALIVYALEPHIVSPLTDDTNTIVAMVSVLNTNLMPAQGSRVDIALDKARELLAQAGVQQGNIVVLTDGINGQQAIDKVLEINDENYQVSVLAIGTPDGAPIPDARGGFVKDRNGGIVIPATNLPMLKEFALAGGGRFSQLSLDDTDINTLGIATQHNSNMLADAKQSDRKIDEWQEEGPWLLLLGLPLIAFGFRRGWLTMIIVGYIAITPIDPVYAFEWSDLWLNKNQQAANLMQQGKPEAAAKKFDDPDWQGAAYYQSGDYAKAVETFAKSTAQSNDFNRGNALAQLGKLEDAIAAYDTALTKDPSNTDAQFNKSLIEEMLKQQQPDHQNADKDQEKNAENQDQQDQQQQAENQQGDSQEQQEAQSSPTQEDEKQPQDSASNSDQQDENAEQSEQQMAQQSDQENQESDSEPQMAQQQQNEGNKEDNKDENNQDPQQSEAEQQRSIAKAETAQATEQWLKRIPDDPGGLLRQKFLRQHQRRQSTNPTVEPW